MMLRCLLFVLFFISVRCQADEVYLKLEPEVSVDHLNIVLGDIASVVSGNETQKKRLSSLVIAEFKNLLSPRLLNRQDIGQQIVRQVPALSNSIVWVGESSVLIHGKRQKISLDVVLDESAQRLIGAADIDQRVELVALNKQRTIDAPLGAVVQKPLFKQARRIGSRIDIPVEIFIDGIVFAKPILQFQVRQYGAAVLANAKLSLNATADKQDVYSNKAADDSQALLPLDQLAGVEHKNFLIKKNEHVRVMVDTGMVHIESEGIALSNANAGDALKIKRLDSKDIFIGQALERGLVSIKEN